MEMSTPANSTNLAILGLHPSAYKVRRTPVIKAKWDVDGARGSERMWGQQTHGSWYLKYFKLKIDFDKNVIIQKALEEYRNTPHSITTIPPVYLLFGIDPFYTSDLTIAYPPIEEARKTANDNTKKLHLKLVKRYNESHKTPNLKIGDKVLYKIPYQSGQAIKVAIEWDYTYVYEGCTSHIHVKCNSTCVRSVVMKSNREFENRAAIIVALHAGRSPKEIVDFLKLPKTTIYRVKKQFDEADSNKEGIATRKKHSRRSDRVRGEEFVKNVKEKIDGNPGKSMRAIAKEMDVGSMTIVRTIHEDLGLKSYALRKGQLLTENMKNNRKGKAAALLNNLKHDSFGMLRFFSDEKNFDVDQKVNPRNDRWICKDPSEIPVVMHTKFPASVMVLGVISSEGDVMPPHFFEKGLRMNADTYINVLETVVKPWMDMVAAGRKCARYSPVKNHHSTKTAPPIQSNPPNHTIHQDSPGFKRVVTESQWQSNKVNTNFTVGRRESTGSHKSRQDMIENEPPQDAKRESRASTSVPEIESTRTLAEILLQLTAVLTQVRPTQHAEVDIPPFDGIYVAHQFFQAYDWKMDEALVTTPEKFLRLPRYLTRQPLELFRKLQLATQTYLQRTGFVLPNHWSTQLNKETEDGITDGGATLLEEIAPTWPRGGDLSRRSMEMSTPANSTNLAILGLHPSAYKVRRTPVIKAKWDVDGARGSERMWGQQTHGSWAKVNLCQLFTQNLIR
ncbi:IKK1 [Cordylochernes scorpioides]|uniref:IKK1 n=1 Tax=Cordylochernes scorpioides TaxID=51811 RepID=A0ABY6KGN5_9ARAC|nr:IKK1 [Cordylochernes scorpioides]